MFINNNFQFRETQQIWNTSFLFCVKVSLCCNHGKIYKCLFQKCSILQIDFSISIIQDYWFSFFVHNKRMKSERERENYCVNRIVWTKGKRWWLLKFINIRWASAVRDLKRKSNLFPPFMYFLFLIVCLPNQSFVFICFD